MVADVLSGEKVYFAGCDGLTKAEAEELAASLGGTVAAGWSPSVAFIFAGNDGSSSGQCPLQNCHMRILP